jgi:pilus assembly protein Flp/PilA
MLRRMRKLFRSESGQGMSEYLIIVALIAVAAIGVVSVFGKDIRALFSASTGSLAGESATNVAVKAKVNSKTLKTFSDGNE